MKDRRPGKELTQGLLIALLVGGLVLVGFFLQLWIAPSPLSLVIYTVMTSVALLAAALTLRGRLLDVMAGFRFSSVVLAALAIAAAAGTLILQGKPPDLYQERYGSLAGLILALRFDDLFHSLWLGGLIALMVAGLVTSALRRWPPTWRHAGFFGVHLGIVVILVGSGLSAVFGVKGRVDLRVDGPAVEEVTVTRAGLPVPPKAPLGASVQLEKFAVDRYQARPTVSFYLPSVEREAPEHKASFEVDLGTRHRLPGDTSFRVKDFQPSAIIKERLVESTEGSPALTLTVDGKETWLTPNERPRVESADRKVVVLFGWQRPTFEAHAPLHTLRSGSGEVKRLRLDETVTFADGTEVRALRFFPHFTYDIDKKQPLNLSDSPVNPALEVTVNKAKRWLFANMPGFSHGEAGPALTYSFSSQGGTLAGTLLLVSGADKTVLVHQADGSERLIPLEKGLEVAGTRFGSLLAKARVERGPDTTSSEARSPVAFVEVTDRTGTRSAWLVADTQDQVEVGKGFLTLETRGNDVKAFTSQVVITQGTRQQHRKIAVNAPVQVGPWKLYQVNFDPKDPRYSGLEAVRDPGVPWVFAGFGLLFLGVVYLLYVAPRQRRRET